MTNENNNSVRFKSDTVSYLCGHDLLLCPGFLHNPQRRCRFEVGATHSGEQQNSGAIELDGGD